MLQKFWKLRKRNLSGISCPRITSSSIIGLKLTIRAEDVLTKHVSLGNLPVNLMILIHLFPVSSSQAQDFTRITKTQGPVNSKYTKENALTGTVRRTPRTKAPMVTRAGIAKILSTNTPGHLEPTTSSCLTNISQYCWVLVWPFAPRKGWTNLNWSKI